VSRHEVDHVAPTFRSAWAGLKAGATSNAVSTYFRDTTLNSLESFSISIVSGCPYRHATSYEVHDSGG